MNIMNKEFFTKLASVGDSGLTLTVNQSEPIELFFGYEGSRQFILNDIRIIPSPSTITQITLCIEGINEGNQIIYNVNDQIDIYQRPDSAIYPNFNLFVGDKFINKKNLFSGHIKIEGDCTIVQKKFFVYDG